MIGVDRFILASIACYSNIRNAISHLEVKAKSQGNSNFCRCHCNCSCTPNILWNGNKRFLWKQRHGQHSSDCTNRRRGICAFFISWLEKKEQRTKERVQRLTVHGNTLLASYRQFDAEDNYMVDGAARRQYILDSSNGRELLEHLYTGHREMYDLLDTDETAFEGQLEYLLRGNENSVTFLACNQCLRHHDQKDIPRLQRELSQLH